MSDIKIADSSGEWFMNTALFRMHDPESDTYFEPGIPTKARVTEWLTGVPAQGNPESPKYKPGTEGQVMIVKIDDPSAPDVVEQSAAVVKEAKIQKHGAEPEQKKA
jgi:hypothetical protein